MLKLSFLKWKIIMILNVMFLRWEKEIDSVSVKNFIDNRICSWKKLMRNVEPHASKSLSQKLVYHKKFLFSWKFIVKKHK